MLGVNKVSLVQGTYMYMVVCLSFVEYCTRVLVYETNAYVYCES